MYFLPSAETAHFQLTITVVVPEQKDGRGRSAKKTLQQIDFVEKMVVYKAISTLWGDPAYFAKLVTATTSRSVHERTNLVTITVAAPVDFERDSLAKHVCEFLHKCLKETFLIYVDCKRHYTLGEVMEHCW